MKALSYVLVFVLSFQFVDAQTTNKFFPNLKKSNIHLLKSGGMVTYVKFSNSINGPFTSPATLSTTDSLFLKMDVTPLGSVSAIFWIDINDNGIIDGTDFSLGGEIFADNAMGDLDPTQGTIIAYLETGGAMPSMQVIAVFSEGMTTVTGIVRFENPPATFSLSGVIYNTDGGVVPGAWVWAISGTNQIGDVADQNGNYLIPLEAGIYFMYVEDMSGLHSSFDTSMVITGNTIQDFYLAGLTSYIRGFVKDEAGNPIANIGVYVEGSGGGRGVYTDSNGEYFKLVPAGNGRIGLNGDDLLPTYISPNSHEFTINENDSIVNNSVSNFTCYRTNAAITGTVKINGNLPTKSYLISGWNDYLQSNTRTVSNATTGNYTLPVYSSPGPQNYYGVYLADWAREYPFPPGSYADTSYWNISPGASNINFNLILADSSAVDPFNGNNIPPSAMWDIYQHNHDNSGVQCVGDKLRVQATNWGSESGVGVFSRKPFQLNNREFRIYIDHKELGYNNTVYVTLSGQKYYWNHPLNERNTLILQFSKKVNGGWHLQENLDWGLSTLWQSPDTTGGHILFQFNADASILTLKINGVVKYQGSWGQNFSVAYVHLLEFNSSPNAPTPVYFDEFFVGAVGSTGVREIAGEIPQEFKLEQNYPNPFNPATTIKFQLPIASSVSLKVYNVLGQEVSDLLNGEINAGIYEVAFDASKLSSGIYYYRLTAVDSKSGELLMNTSRKAILLK
ncbi:MAG: T9SS type A sorting domain-containing protein [Bacteroidota bacterium]|nr:T9SS type A sorting domain-containing protein [Bacteroidota bacterium]